MTRVDKKSAIQELFLDGYNTKEIAFLTGLCRHAINYHVAPVRPKGSLTARQRQVLVCVANGMSTKEIAEELNVTQGAIERYRIIMMREVKVRNSSQLVAWGFKNKYLI